ncbi:MAG: malto-oligosyltrehalose synthase, partial [Achromobacter spanius]
DESLDARWPTEGTTGYDFMDQVGALLHAPEAQAQLERCWVALSGDPRDATAQLRDARHRMLARHFPAERQALVRALTRIARFDLRTRDWTSPAIDRVLTALLAAFPVYRSYAEDGGRSAADAHWCRVAVDQAREALGDATADARLLEQIDEWLGGAAQPRMADRNMAEQNVRDQNMTAQHTADTAVTQARALALRRFQQLTPPLAAKALEDTLFYRRGPLLSRNEVGSSPTRFSLPLQAFHALSAARARTHPHAMLATA